MKKVNENIENIKEDSIKLIGIFLFIILITFITVLLVYFIGLYKYDKSRTPLDSLKINTTVEDIEYESVEVIDNLPLNEKCIESCKIKTKVGKENIYYYIRKQDNSYMLDINRLYIKIASINIGDNIDSLVLSKYNDIDMIKTIYHDEASSYDEVIFVNEVNKDIITSVSTNEIEVTSDGIIYYTYSCLKSGNTNSMKFKNIRKPFDNTNTIMSVEDVNLDYC